LHRFFGTLREFTTGAVADVTPPTVEFIDPVDTDVGVPINGRVTLRMSEPIQPTDVSDVNFTLAVSGGDTVLATYAASAGDTLFELRPQDPLAPLTSYDVEVFGLCDRAGNTMAAPVTVTFTTGVGADFTGPQLISTVPPPSDTGVDPGAVVTVTYGSPISAPTAGASTYTLRNLGNSMNEPFSVSFNAARDVVTLTPLAPMESGKVYRFTANSASTGVKDTSGNGQVSFFQIQFTVAE
jgi:hypothetical protein